MGNKKSNTGWTIHTQCLQYKLSQNKPIIIYGVGAGLDVSWDIEMVKQFNSNSYIFDPTPKSIHTITPIINTFNIKYKQLPNITFIHEGLSNKEGIINFELPKNNKAVSMKEMPNNIENKNNKNMISAKVNTLQNWMKRFNHNYIDILKMDIEGSEYDVLEQLIKDNILPFTQLLVEFHHRFYDGIYQQKHQFVTNELIKHGFQPFKKIKDKYGRDWQEFSYVKVNDLKHCPQV